MQKIGDVLIKLSDPQSSTPVKQRAKQDLVAIALEIIQGWSEVELLNAKLITTHQKQNHTIVVTEAEFKELKEAVNEKDDVEILYADIDELWEWGDEVMFFIGRNEKIVEWCVDNLNGVVPFVVGVPPEDEFQSEE